MADRSSLGDMPTFHGRYRDITPGDSIGPNGRYVIKQSLGRGAMGQVFLAQDTLSGTDVAVKLVPRDVADSAEEMERVRRNFALVHDLHHPHIAAVAQLEPLASAGEYFIVMEAVKNGRTLHGELLNRPQGRIPVLEAIAICRQVADALDYAHGKNVMHRDVKPGNIMLQDVSPAAASSDTASPFPKGGGRAAPGDFAALPTAAPHPSTLPPFHPSNAVVKVTDFGLAAQILASMHRVSRMALATSGTRPYMAPEQWRGTTQDGRTDQWALAVLFYEMVAGRLPFPADDPAVLERQVLRRAPERPAELKGWQWRAVLKALAKDRTKRFSSCTAFVVALEGRGRGLRKLGNVLLTGALLAGAAAAVYFGAAWYQHQTRQRPAQAEIPATAQTAPTSPAPVAPVPPVRAATGGIYIETEPSGATVSIGPLDVQKSPATFRNITAGTQTVKVEHEHYYPTSFAFLVPADDFAKTNVALRRHVGSILVESVPPAAQIWIGESDTGKSTPAVIANLLTGLRSVTLRKDGYEDATGSVTVRKDEQTHASLNMERIRGPREGQAWTVPDANIELVWIPAGTFTMGSPAGEADRFSDEGPQHQVTISRGFWMGKCEVTQAQWRRLKGDSPSNFKGDNLPVEQVSWNDCMDFCERLTQQEQTAGRLPDGYVYRLPTEAEWEYACRAKTETPFHYGDSLDATMANFDGNYPYGNGQKGEYRQTTTPVGSFAHNAFGLYDMHGNVWEWCADWFDSGYYANSPRVDPRGPESGRSRVVRGGSWSTLAWYCRAAFRGNRAPDARSDDLGVRVVCVPRP